MIRKSDNTIYEGEWKAQKHHGKGTLILKNPNGEEIERYEGDWIDGQKSGQGIFRAADGTVYEGSWLNDMVYLLSIFFICIFYISYLLL